MKKLLLFFIAMLCVALLYPQVKKNKQNNPDSISLSNDEFFEQAELVIEGELIWLVHTYTFGDSTNYKDVYGIDAFRVLRVYKGDPSLKDSIIYVARKGVHFGLEKEGIPLVSSYTPKFFVDNGINQGINVFTPSIYSFVASDFPDDETSKYASQKKYKYLSRLYVLGNKIIGLGDLVIHQREDFYNYMRQFDGFTVPEMPKEQEVEWTNGAELDADILAPECYEKMKILTDSLLNEAKKEKPEDSKKKEQEVPNGSTANKNLTLRINNLVKIQESSKWFVKFDVLASSNDPNTYLSETAMSIVYDKNLFGNLPLGKINISISSYFTPSGSDYIAYLVPIRKPL